MVAAAALPSGCNYFATQLYFAPCLLYQAAGENAVWGWGEGKWYPGEGWGWKDVSMPSVSASLFNLAALAMTPRHPLMQMGGMDLVGAMLSWDPDSL